MPPCPEGDEECMKGMHDGGMPPCPEGDEECMKGMGPPPAVHECFENQGSPDKCCSLMGDEQGKEMCMMHSSQDGPDNMGPPH